MLKNIEKCSKTEPCKYLSIQDPHILSWMFYGVTLIAVLHTLNELYISGITTLAVIQCIPAQIWETRTGNVEPIN